MMENARIDFDDIWQKYSKVSRIEFACFSFHVGLLFLSTFCLSNRIPKITSILTLCQANVATLTLFSKEDNFWSKIYMNVKVPTLGNKISEQFWTKNSINRLLVKFGTVDGRPGSGRRSAHWWKRRHSWVTVAESGEQNPEPPNNQKHFKWGGGSIDHQFRGLF